MRLEGVDFRNPGQIRHQRRADGTARADDIAVGKRFLNQFDRDHVERRKSVADDRAQFLVDALLNDLGQGIVVDLNRAAHRALAQFALRLRPKWLERLLAFRVLDVEIGLFNLIGDLVWHVDDHALRDLFAEVRKFVDHLISRFKIQRRLILRVFKAL